MRKFKYVFENKYGYENSLTIDKIYDAIECIEVGNYIRNSILIIDDYGYKNWFFIYSGYNTPFFKEVTIEERNKVIDGILT